MASNCRSSIYLSIGANFPMTPWALTHLHNITAAGTRTNWRDPALFPACRPQHTWFFKELFEMWVAQVKKQQQRIFLFCLSPSQMSSKAVHKGGWLHRVAHHPPFGSGAGGSVLTESRKIHCSTPCAVISFAETWFFFKHGAARVIKGHRHSATAFLSSLLARRNIFQIL